MKIVNNYIDSFEEHSRPNPISGRKLQLIIGILAFAFPPVLYLGASFFECTDLLPSLSAYYHSEVGDFFVGALCCIALILIAYEGYSNFDNIVTSIAGILALLVAFFPTSVKDNCCFGPLEYGTIGVIHYMAAGLLFFLLAFISLYLFTRSKGEVSDEKARRNKIYRVCGWIIVLSIVLLVIYFFYPPGVDSPVHNIRPVFVLESIAVFSFGISWLVKSEILVFNKG